MDPQIRPIHTAALAAPRPPFQKHLSDLILVRDLAAHWRAGGIVLLEDQLAFMRAALVLLEAINSDCPDEGPEAA